MLKYLRLGAGLAPHLTKAGFWIGRLDRNREKIPVDERYGRVRHLIDVAFDHFRIDLFVSGTENIPSSTNALFTPNHQSLMDAVILIKLFDKPITFVSKEETRKVPYIGRIISLIGGEFIERNNLRQEIRLMRRVAEQLAAGVDFVIFPEGTRTKDSELKTGEFKAGSFKVAFTAERPIIPIAIYGTDKVLDQQRHEKRYAVQVKFLPPLQPTDFLSGTTQDVAAAVKSSIDCELDAMRKRDQEEFQTLKKYNKK